MQLCLHGVASLLTPCQAYAAGKLALQQGSHLKAALQHDAQLQRIFPHAALVGYCSPLALLLLLALVQAIRQPHILRSQLGILLLQGSQLSAVCRQGTCRVYYFCSQEVGSVPAAPTCLPCTVQLCRRFEQA